MPGFRDPVISKAATGIPAFCAAAILKDFKDLKDLRDLSGGGEIKKRRSKPPSGF